MRAHAHVLYGCLCMCVCVYVMDRSQKLKKKKAGKSFDLWTLTLTLSTFALGNRFIQFVVYAAMWHAYGKIFVSKSELTLYAMCRAALCGVVLYWIGLSVCLTACRFDLNENIA